MKLGEFCLLFFISFIVLFVIINIGAYFLAFDAWKADGRYMVIFMDNLGFKIFATFLGALYFSAKVGRDAQEWDKKGR